MPANQPQNKMTGSPELVRPNRTSSSSTPRLIKVKNTSGVTLTKYRAVTVLTQTNGDGDTDVPPRIFTNSQSEVLLETTGYYDGGIVGVIQEDIADDQTGWCVLEGPTKFYFIADTSNCRYIRPFKTGDSTGVAGQWVRSVFPTNVSIWDIDVGTQGTNEEYPTMYLRQMPIGDYRIIPVTLVKDGGTGGSSSTRVSYTYEVVYASPNVTTSTNTTIATGVSPPRGGNGLVLAGIEYNEAGSGIAGVKYDGWYGEYDRLWGRVDEYITEIHESAITATPI